MTLAEKRTSLFAPVAALCLATILVLGGCEPLVESGPPVPYTGPASDVLDKYFEQVKNRPSRGYKMEVRFDGELPKLQKKGTLLANRVLTANGQVRYSVQSFEGDDTVRKDVIFRYMTAETKARHDDGDALSINTSNYAFKYRGLTTVNGQNAHTFQLTPRRKNPGLFKGAVLIDASTYFPIREEGRFVESPSMFLKRIEFVRDYSVVDGVPFPSLLISKIETRFWGDAILQVKFSDITALAEGEDPIPSAPPTANSKSRAPAGSKKAVGAGVQSFR